MGSLQNIKAVTFDVGGTLMKPFPSVGHVYAEVAARHGKNIPAAVLNQRFAKAWRGLKHFSHGREEWSALVDQAFAGLWQMPPDGSFFSELYDRFSEPDAWQVFDDVRPALDSLAARGINLGIISNWDERLRPLLARLGLAEYFETIIISCEVGFTKPSPVIFEQAAKRLGLAPKFILHVGDSVQHDVAGAKGAGYGALLLERGAEDVTEGTIRSLGALEEM
ncbi:MAG: HAD-superfamily hydrolase [Pedosphaera sp.]|nr:HAD-superfamily hydrolase [Pedosphaera sp.]